MIHMDDKKRTLMAWIPARGGSKGLPRKALLDLGGKPVIAHTIEQALAVKGMDRVLVNTDDEEIRDIARLYGAEVPFLRPKEFAQDTSSLDDALQYQWEWLKQHEGFDPEIHIGMSPTYPIRTPSNIDDAINIAKNDDNVVNIRSVSTILNTLDNYWILNKYKPTRFIFKDYVNTKKIYKNLFSFNIIFSFRSHLFHNKNFKKPVPLPIPTIESIDIDEEKDLLVARKIIKSFHIHTQAKNQTHYETYNFIPAHSSDIIINDGYPNIQQEDLVRFKKESVACTVPAITACLVDEDEHPYRLMTTDCHGRLEYLVDIDNSIRGARQQYPNIYKIVPAILCHPQQFGKNFSDTRLILFDKEKFFRNDNQLDALMLCEL